MKKLLSLVLVSLMVLSVISTVFADVYSDAELLLKVPKKNSAYMKDCDHHGTVEIVKYQTRSYALEAVSAGTAAPGPDNTDENQEPLDVAAICVDRTEFPLEKSMYVYLPYNYDPNAAYDVLFIMHGTGEDESVWLGDGTVGQTIRNMLDWMIDEGKCKPMIAVGLSYYSIPEEMMEAYPELSASDPLANYWPMYFWKEMRNEVLPLIDSTYATYGNAENARDHRGFIGFSRGSMTTVNSIMLHCLDQFSYIGNLSGIWCDFETFRATLESEEYKDLDIKLWYNGEGTNDFARDNHEPFRDLVLANMADRFVDGENYAYVVVKNGTHNYSSWFPQIYNLLQLFFTR